MARVSNLLRAPSLKGIERAHERQILVQGTIANSDRFPAQSGKELHEERP